MKPFQRLPALDASFLALESRTTPFVVGGRLIFGADGLRRRDGALDAGRLERYVRATLTDLPRYRQRLLRVPLFGNPVWADDQDFVLSRHLRFSALDPPGSLRQLDDAVGRILSEELDMSHPPWELHVVDGLVGGRFALVGKVHHCLVDGIAGVRLIQKLLTGEPAGDRPEAHLGSPAPRPGRLELFAAEARHRLEGIGQLAATGLRAALRGRRSSGGGEGRGRLSRGDVTGMVRRSLTPAADVGLNPRRPDRGRHFRGFSMSLAEVHEVKERLGVSVNDVVLAVAAGAFRRCLERRALDPDAIHDFRAMVPVNLRPRGEAPAFGNLVTLLLVQLPIDVRDPLERARRVRRRTRRGKEESRDVESGAFLIRLADAVTPALLTTALRTALRLRAFNVVITNVPGPSERLYLLDAELESFSAIVNVWPRQSVGLAVLSYRGRLFWGAHAARRAFPDVDDLVSDLRASFEELKTAALGDEAPPEGAAPGAWEDRAG